MAQMDSRRIANARVRAHLFQAGEGGLPGELGALVAVGARDLLRGLDAFVPVVDCAQADREKGRSAV